MVQFKTLFFPFNGYSPKMILQTLNPSCFNHFSKKVH